MSRETKRQVCDGGGGEWIGNSGNSWRARREGLGERRAAGGLQVPVRKKDEMIRG